MAEIEFELFNNQLVQQLVGPQDGNLKIIEKALGAEIAAFGNRIRISGDEEAVRQAKNAVDALYSKVSRGIAVGEQEVLAAVRISGAEANVKPQVNIDDIVLKTKKRHIYPRSATQAEYIVWGSNGDMPISRPVPCLPGVFKYGNPQSRIHLTEKPLQLMRDIVKITEPGGHILDPFAGSGTTVLAAVQEGYTATGIEVTDTYAELARERIRAELEKAA